MKNLKFLLPILLLIMLTSCTEKYPVSSEKAPITVKSSCVSCHLNSDLLKQVATPLPPVESSGGEG